MQEAIKILEDLILRYTDKTIPDNENKFIWKRKQSAKREVLRYAIKIMKLQKQTT